MIDLGRGDDTFTGGAKAEHVRDGDGTNNSYKLGDGNDTFIAVKTGGGGDSNTDNVDGGRGIDTLRCKRRHNYCLAQPRHDPTFLFRENYGDRT